MTKQPESLRKSLKTGIIIILGLLMIAGTAATAAIVTQGITYQGKLTDAAGNTLTGTYSVKFSLYEAATGGTALASTTQSVTCTNGLFTTALPLAATNYDGRALWLGIRAGSDPEMTPRQEIRPVPYAESLRPGAVIVGDASTNPSLKVINTASNVAGLIAGTTGTNSPALYASSTGPGSPAVYASGINDAGISAVGKYGGYFRTSSAGTASDLRSGVRASTSYDYNPGITVETTGAKSEGISVMTGQSTGIRVMTQGDGSSGLNIQTAHDNSDGIDIETSGMNSWGLNAVTNGDQAYGVEVTTRGDASHGMIVYTRGADSAGIIAESEKDVGIAATGALTGGEFTTTSGGTDVIDVHPGLESSTTFDYNPGMIAKTTGDYSNGITIHTAGSMSDGMNIQTSGTQSSAVSAQTFFDASPVLYAFTYGTDSDAVNVQTSGPSANGILASAHGEGSIGVVGYGEKAEGVFGWSGDYAGVHGSSSSKAGVWGISYGDVGVYGDTSRSDHQYGVLTRDYMSALGYHTNSGDVAEYMPAAGDISPGTVLIIGDDGRLRPSAGAYDTRVAGIVSTAPGVTLGKDEAGNPGEALIAVAGRVPCKVDAGYGAIHPGDILSTSDTPGYAMKAAPLEYQGRTFYPSGTILGKAMGTIESGTGVIEVLVTLQ